MVSWISDYMLHINRSLHAIPPAAAFNMLLLLQLMRLLLRQLPLLLLLRLLHLWLLLLLVLL